MAILRNTNREQYVVITQSTVRDGRLKNKDLGALVRLLALPDYWDFSVAGLIHGHPPVMPEGKDSVSTAIHTLEACGYLVRTQKNTPKGRYAGYDWVVYETPLAGFPPTVKPSTESPPQSNNIKNLKINNIVCDTLAPDDYASLVAIHGKDIVDYTINRILNNNYRNCMNHKTIDQWCREYRARTPCGHSPPTKKNAFLQYEQRDYDYDALERDLLGG